MSKLTPQEAAEKQARNLKNSIPDITAGVNRVTEAPGIKAAAKADKMRANLIKSLDDGTWANNVKSVTVDQWKDKMLKKGVNRISDGIDAARPKVEGFFQQLFPYQDQLITKVNGMRDVTLEDNIARMTAMVRGMADFKYKK